MRFAIRRDTPPIGRLDDLKTRILAVNKGSIYDIWAQANQAKYGFTTQTFPTQPDAVQAVLTGHADATLAASTVLQWMARTTPQLEPGIEVATGQYWAIPVRHDDVAMRDRIDLAIKCLKRHGDLARIAEQWFGPQSPDAASVKIFPGRGTPGFPGWDPTPQPSSC